MSNDETFSSKTRLGLCETVPKNACCCFALRYGYDLFSHEQTERFSRLRSTAEKEKTEQFLLQVASVRPKRHRLMPDVIEEQNTDLANDRIDPSAFVCSQCRGHFLRGVFLACGTITNPGLAYHLELLIPKKELASDLMAFLESVGLPPKFLVRRNQLILYYKESERLEDFFHYIGAQKTAFEVINTKIFKDLRNNANRLANCDAANIDKTVSAATAQIAAIKTISEKKKMHLLPDDLIKTAQLRLSNPDMPLSELAALHDPPISKSGLNHRLNKLIRFSEEC